MIENLLNMRKTNLRSAEELLLHGVHIEATDTESTEAKKFTGCVECGEEIPVYFSYFCEKHFIEFLEGTVTPFANTLDSFTISHSQ